MSAAEQRFTAPAAERQLSDIIGSVVAEIRQTAALVDSCHAIPAPRVAGGAVDPEFIRQMQTVDRVNQRLAGLADFLAELRGAMPADWRLDADAALAIVKLHNLAQQLATSEEQPEAPAPSTECFFF